MTSPEPDLSGPSRSPSNPKLERALKEYSAVREDESKAVDALAAVFEALAHSWVLLGVRELPRELHGKRTVLQSDLQLEFMMVKNDAGEPVLQVFSSLDALRARNATVDWITMHPASLIKLAKREGDAGLVINVAGECVTVPRDCFDMVLEAAES